jgi:hypothetical protein
MKSISIHFSLELTLDLSWDSLNSRMTHPMEEAPFLDRPDLAMHGPCWHPDLVFHHSLPIGMSAGSVRESRHYLSLSSSLYSRCWTATPTERRSTRFYF